MYQVTDDFIQALRFTHQVYATLTVTPPSGDPVSLGIQSGSVTANYQQGTRRTADISVHATGTLEDGSSVPAADVAAMLKRAGTVCRVEAGISSSLISRTMIPMVTGSPSDVAWRVGDGVIDLNVTDDWWRVSQGRLTTTWTPNAGTRRVDAVSTLMQQAAPNRQTVSSAADTGTIQSQGDWGVDRDAAINTLSTDGGFDAYFDREGRIILQDAKTASDPVVWTATSGDGGVLVTAETGLDVQRLYNTVVVKPSATDSSQTWTAQTASLTTGDRAPANLGVTIPYFLASPTISSATAALRVAQQLLGRVTGTPETLQTDMIGNPALDEGDVIEILIPGNDLDGTAATLWRYYVDTITWDLVSGGMTVKARNEGEVTESASA
jgi:hypothetical protein